MQLHGNESGLLRKLKVQQKINYVTIAMEVKLVAIVLLVYVRYELS